MVERPILFSGPLVRAILDGRKTETRRLVTKGTSRMVKATRDAWGELDWSAAAINFAPGSYVGRDGGRIGAHRGLLVAHEDTSVHGVACRIEPGDVLWVRERIWQSRRCGYMAEWGEWEAGAWTRSVVRYHATEGAPESTDLPGREFLSSRPSIHMPKWVSRIRLRVTDVRAEGLHEIDEAGARAEGIAAPIGTAVLSSGDEVSVHATARTHFATLWDEINGKREGARWDDNPWVWVYKFEVER